MLEPPKHSGPFRRTAILEVAARILRRPPQPKYAAGCAYLQPGKLTVLFGPSNNERSRFAVALISGLLESGRHIEAKAVCWFNRRALYLEILKMLLQHETSRLLAQCGGNHQEAMIQAIEHIQFSGLEYDTQCKTVEAICAKVQAQQASQPAQLVVVDGLEHFHTEAAENSRPFDFSKQLRQLKQLAQQNVFPVLATSPCVTEVTDEDSMVKADYSIHLCNKE
jgi:replicative DNA helicase